MKFANSFESKGQSEPENGPGRFPRNVGAKLRGKPRTPVGLSRSKKGNPRNSEATMQKAILYARVSSREQEQEGYSIPAQQRLLREYASKNDLEITKEFVDIETAKMTGRKAFGEMVEFLSRTKGGRIVLVEKTDRLYRNFRDAVTLEDLETEIHFVKENQVLSKDSRSQDKLTHGLHLLIARNYIENLREEVIKGMREKAEQGAYPGRAPFGYGFASVVCHAIGKRLCPLTSQNEIPGSFGGTLKSFTQLGWVAGGHSSWPIDDATRTTAAVWRLGRRETFLPRRSGSQNTPRQI
jgi:DNA invertase Pin-like site-specific DNA recombinase